VVDTPDIPLALRPRLLAVSRTAIAAALSPDATDVPITQIEPPCDDPVLETSFGLFVTLRRAGTLRGCIGRITTADPLRVTIPVVSVDAALRDRRFPPLTRDELSGVTIEHSVLTPPAAISSVADFQPGRDGIILTVGAARAVFLPEVATEQGWDRAMTLRALSRKAGLDADAWRRPEATYMTFQTVHYGE
jgi:AmmeMemoRadiSam system protein A